MQMQKTTNAKNKKKMSELPIWLEMFWSNKREDGNQSCFDVSVWMRVGNERGPRDPIRLLIVTNARILLYHPYKQCLCQAHYRATNDFIS